MPTHQDAVGYLNDLATEINLPWFTMVCDIATLRGVSGFDTNTRDAILAIYRARASYVGIARTALAASTGTAVTPADYLEKLLGFSNFKLLADGLEISFEKQMALIFGANGSGKSSLCESLKILAATQPPIRPVENVRTPGATIPSFGFKFRSDRAPQAWSPAAGYGPRRSTVKYFDTGIAVQNVTSAVEPGRVIVLAPFKLYIFEDAKSLTGKFRLVLQQLQQDNKAKLTEALAAIRTEFADFKGSALSGIDDKKLIELPREIKLGEEFRDQELLVEKRAAAGELEKATSDEGLKLLRAEHRELESFLSSLNELMISTAELWTLEPAKKAETLAEKQAAQEMIAKVLIPTGSNLEAMLGLLRAASAICKMDQATGQYCPLCKRDLTSSEIELFKKYHALVMGELEQDISAIKASIARADVLATAVTQMDRKVWDKYKTIPADILEAAHAGSDDIVANCAIATKPSDDALTAFESLKTLATTWATLLESKTAAIETAGKGRDELMKQLTTLRAELQPLEYARAIASRLEGLKAVQQLVDEDRFWNSSLPVFTQVLKKITEKAKEAHEELVVVDFESRLNSEYRALAEKDMAAFGVKLARKGTDAAVTVLPQVGGKGIEGVLSEGEQRLHALALFFAELETCRHSVLVFDDPISSFDYNYIANYCARLRDFAVKYPDRQIIVLTHNWEFFVQLQNTMNKSRLSPRLSVHVLENCCAIGQYSDKIDDLKSDISTILGASGEPSKAKKEELAAKMRRLIEAVVNTHVFNRQRHQFKQKSQAVTAFADFTKLVALLPAEATSLRDLYEKLSIAEHDDPRNAYVNTDKAMFQTRYDQIIAIKNAIKARVP